MKWLPLDDAARQMGLSVAALVEELATDKLELPLAVKCDGWRAGLCIGGRRKALDRVSGDLHVNRELHTAGYYRLHDTESKMFALRWPAPKLRCELWLWLDESPDDLYALFETDPVPFESVFVDAEQMGLLVEKVNAQKLENLLRLLGVLAQAAGLDHAAPIDPAASVVAEWCKAAGAPISKNTITSRLKEARLLVRAVDFQTLPKIPKPKT